MTICTEDKECLFGDVMDGAMRLNDAGIIIENVWIELKNRFPNIELDEFVIMPNHFHGIIVITNNENGNGRGLIHQTQHQIHSTGEGLMNQGLMNQTPTNWILMQNSKQTLGKIIRYFKAKTSKLVHDKGESHFQWQRNYHEHIVRNEADINRIRQYICDNPVKWETDEDNPDRRGATCCALTTQRAPTTEQL